MIRLQRKVRLWLGLGDAFMGVDIGFRDQSAIVIISRLGDGAVRIIDCKFGSIQEIERLMAELQVRYGILHENIIADYPFGFRRGFHD